MSDIEVTALTEEIVAEFLKDNPDFFQHHRELVDRLAIPNQEQGAVSLVHLQMNRQRQRIEELEEEITALMSMAKNNDRTFHEFMDLQEQVLKCEVLEQVIHAVQNKAKALGLSAFVRLIDAEQLTGNKLSHLSLTKEQYQRFSTNNLNGRDAYLGRMRKADRIGLLGEQTPAPEMGSYVVLPLVKGKLQGVLVFASEDGGHFQPHMDTLFLRHLALVLSHLIETLPWQSVEHERISSHTAQ
ncbi:DUF484 family protein [Vibrio paucivorans]|uniref:DUF484 family protein n=1 Tax=Vibrio paucivorans TaxID=2829489 RepID=A0A9X3CFW0_9VIBR|nr:DUF484 family protein [Vibrio paucivorans]MCW8334987.1 DUF484 family protein [Vibrio paucivorans]